MKGLASVLAALTLVAGAAPGLAALTLTPAPLCRVEARTRPARIAPQRIVAITIRGACPPGGVARVRLASKLGGTLPDNPPGAYTIRPGQTLQRVMLPFWHVEWISASGKPYRVQETP